MTHEQLESEIKQGSYGKVVLSKQAAGQHDYGVVQKPREGIMSRFLGRGKSEAGSVNAGNAGARVAKGVAEFGAIDPDWLAYLPAGDMPQDVLDQAELIGATGNLYAEHVRERAKAGERIPYSLGLKLSDLLELMDPALAARILISASQPEVAQNEIEFARRLGYIGEDPQVLAVEAAVLLPREVRGLIFREMITLESQRPGRPLAFFRSIAANLFNQSELSASRLIQANIQGEEALEKINEVREDLIEFGPLFRGETQDSSQTA